MAAIVEGPYGATRTDIREGYLADSASGSAASAVSWAAIIGGASAAVAMTLILLELGAGLGLAAISPWPHLNPSPMTFTVTAAIWLIVVQWIAASFGGYIAGRLRTKWIGVHTDEVFFRDTLHGFLSWAVATMVGVVLVVVATFATISGTVGSGTVGTATTIANGAAQTATRASPASTERGDNFTGPSAYLVDTLFRSEAPPGAADASRRDMREEAGLILTTDLRSDDVTSDDRAYLAQIIATQTGISRPDAEKRVDDVVAKLKAAKAKAADAANVARKAAASAAIVMALAMLIGAFIAGTAGAIGGARRDEC
jgi:hypothetical protein